MAADALGRTPLYIAAQKGDAEGLETLIAGAEAESGVDQASARGLTPLFAAAREGHGRCEE